MTKFTYLKKSATFCSPVEYASAIDANRCVCNWRMFFFGHFRSRAHANSTRSPDLTEYNLNSVNNLSSTFVHRKLCRWVRLWQWRCQITSENCCDIYGGCVRGVTSSVCLPSLCYLSHGDKLFLHRFTSSNSSILHAVHSLSLSLTVCLCARTLRRIFSFNFPRNGSSAPSAHCVSGRSVS